MSNKLKNELYDLFYSYDTVESLYEKGFLWDFFSYLSKLYPNDLDIQKMFKGIALKAIKIKKQLEDDNKKLNREEKIFMKENKKFFQEFLPKLDNIEIDEIDDFPKEKNSYLIIILESFLKSVSIDFYQFYQKMVNEERIIMAPISEMTFSSLENSNSLIFLEKFDTVYDVMVLVHELAHAYYCYINNETFKDRRVIERSIKEEIPSRMLELMFINFINKLQLNYIYEMLNNEYIGDIKYYDRNRSELVNIKYLIGSYIAYQLYGEYGIEDFFQYVHNKSYQELLMDVSDKKMDYKGKVLVK